MGVIDLFYLLFINDYFAIYLIFLNCSCPSLEMTLE